MEQGFEGTRGCLGVHGSLWRNTSLSSRWDPELHFSAHCGRPRPDSVEVEAPGKESLWKDMWGPWAEPRMGLDKAPGLPPSPRPHGSDQPGADPCLPGLVLTALLSLSEPQPALEGQGQASTEGQTAMCPVAGRQTQASRGDWPSYALPWWLGMAPGVQGPPVSSGVAEGTLFQPACSYISKTLGPWGFGGQKTRCSLASGTWRPTLLSRAALFPCFSCGHLLHPAGLRFHGWGGPSGASLTCVSLGVPPYT